MPPFATRRGFLQALEMLVVRGLLSRTSPAFAYFFQASEFGGPVSVDQLDYEGNPLQALSDFVGQNTQEINNASNAIGNSIVNMTVSVVNGTASGSYIFGVGVQESAAAQGIGVTVSEGAVMSYDPSTTKLEAGAFVSVSPELSTPSLLQTSAGPVAILGRGDLTNGFYGQSATGGGSANLGEVSGSASVSANSQYEGLSVSVGVGISAGPSLPTGSYTEESMTYGQSTVISIDGGAMMEQVYNTLWNMSQDPFTGGETSGAP